MCLCCFKLCLCFFLCHQVSPSWRWNPTCNCRLWVCGASVNGVRSSTNTPKEASNPNQRETQRLIASWFHVFHERIPITILTLASFNLNYLLNNWHLLHLRCQSPPLPMYSANSAFTAWQKLPQSWRKIQSSGDHLQGISPLELKWLVKSFLRMMVEFHTLQIHRKKDHRSPWCFICWDIVDMVDRTRWQMWQTRYLQSGTDLQCIDISHDFNTHKASYQTTVDATKTTDHLWKKMQTYENMRFSTA